MKNYLAPEVEFFALAADVIMASAGSTTPGGNPSNPGTPIDGSENETAKDYIADLVIGDVDNI